MTESASPILSHRAKTKWTILSPMTTNADMLIRARKSVTRRDGRVQRTYTAEDIREAARHYAIIGSFRGVERAIGIPDQTLIQWQKKEEWQAALSQAKAQMTEEHIAKFQNLVTESQKAVLERIKKGDEVIVAGEVRRLKVKAKDLAVIAAIATDKAQLLSRQPTSIVGSDGRLEKIAERLVQTLLASRTKVVASQDAAGNMIEGG